MNPNEQELKWMMQALALAAEAQDIDEVPVGAIVVAGGRVVGSGYNMPITKQSPVAHAEIIALEAAAKEVGNYRLLGTSLYVTLEPCLMCYGAMVHARIDRCVFAAPDSKSGVLSCGMVDAAEKYVNHKVTMVGGVMAEESAVMLKNFFKEKRSRG